jgi:hypothetical protein
MRPVWVLLLAVATAVAGNDCRSQTNPPIRDKLMLCEHCRGSTTCVNQCDSWCDCQMGRDMATATFGNRGCGAGVGVSYPPRDMNWRAKWQAWRCAWWHEWDMAMLHHQQRVMAQRVRELALAEARYAAWVDRHDRWYHGVRSLSEARAPRDQPQQPRPPLPMIELTPPPYVEPTTNRSTPGDTFDPPGYTSVLVNPAASGVTD